MKCVVCNERKGKRDCPAKGALICARCCGEKRILEIDCSETCEYLKEGRAREVSQNYMRRLRPQDPAKALRYQHVFENLEELISHIEYVIAEERRDSRHLTDRDVGEVVDLLLETLRTEEKGIIYEHTSNNLRTEPLRRRLREVIQSHRHPRREDIQRIRLADAIDCLELIRDLIESHAKAASSATAYVDLLRRMLPARGRVAHGGSSLIIPGR
ncbi:MAG: hypothetical protein HXY20_02305 [Acidobacteria bacterium]|nr:hypothetical protein [Acidobacteriota bacterium]